MRNLSIQKLRVALPCSGLGHITRGIETWTRDMAQALKARDVDVTLLKGGGETLSTKEKRIRCLQRDKPLMKKIMAIRPGWSWRVGLATPYTFEQCTFNACLWPHLIVGKFDIIHTQDPQIALFCQRFNQFGLMKAKVILAHGTEEPFAYLNRFRHLQHLAPFHRDEMQLAGFKKPQMFAIGNFIDTDKFQPRSTSPLREELNIPQDAFVVTSVAAIKRTHKRIDHLIKECAQLNDPRLHVIVAGSQGVETPELVEMGHQALSDRIHFLKDFDHHRIPDVHAAADIFVLCSLKDMMPIALLEAISSGLPAVTHTYPVEAWMIGQGGDAIDMSQSGVLAEKIKHYMNDKDYLQKKSLLARDEACQRFARDVIMDDIMAMYQDVLRENDGI